MGQNRVAVIATFFSRYVIRFTRRKPRRTWSVVNIKRVRELTRMGLMQPAGLKAFRERNRRRTALYSHEQADPKLGGAYERKLKAHKGAWDFFRAQAPWYQKAASWWVTTAKREDTRLRRLTTLIEYSARRRTVPPLTRR